jgi:hypothetical protein
MIFFICGPGIFHSLRFLRLGSSSEQPLLQQLRSRCQRGSAGYRYFRSAADPIELNPTIGPKRTAIARFQ